MSVATPYPQASYHHAPTHHAPSVSFEVFPPKSADQDMALSNAMGNFGDLNPSFVSVTCGAGGSTRVQTYATVRRIQERLGVPTAAHVTCQGQTKDSITRLANDYQEAGIRHIVALRGDAPKDDAESDFVSAADLVRTLRGIDDFEISVAAYPEVHPKAPNADADLDALKEKIDAGATRAITQFFFDADVFLRFRDRAEAAGISVPIVPGILPIMNFARTVQMAVDCGSVIPDRLKKRFARAQGLPEIEKQLGLEEAMALCGRLEHHGVNAFHIYTLNRTEAATAICRSLGVRASAA